MPQPPTANMGLVLPDDHGSSDVWDVILDTAFGLIDSHNHTPGRGVLIPAAALNINADVSWSSGGTSRAITDLRALDFTAVADTSVTALANAFFTNSADNNLYWRNSGGTNVQLTNGAALNVAAFAGGIGGDYSAVGALEVFDDATDSYWFQQQLGAGVRQYARMRSADVDLYEFKAHPAGGPVPTNRVRLASPTALAASYTLTLPTALGSTARSVVEVTNAGVARFRNTTLMLNGAAGVPISGTVSATASAANSILLCSANSTFVIPIPMSVAATFSAWAVYMFKASNATRTISAQLYQFNMLTNVSTAIGVPQSTSANAPGVVPLIGAGTPNASDCSFYILVTVGPNDAVSDRYLGSGINE